MADHLSSRGAEARYPSGDPFAELSRIMAVGQPVREEAVSDDHDDLDMNLERELMGEADFAPEPVFTPEPAAAARHAAPEAEADALPFDDDYADPLADEFADAFAAEFGSGRDLRGQTPPADTDLRSWEHDAREAPAQPAAEPRQIPEAMLAEVDMDFGDLDLTDDMPAIEDDPEPEAEARPVPVAAPLSMEDELSALLAADDGAAAQSMAPAMAPSMVDEPAPYIPLRAEHAYAEQPAYADEPSYGDEPSHADVPPYEEQPSYADEHSWQPQEAAQAGHYDGDFAADAEEEFLPEEPVSAHVAEPEPQPQEPDPFAIFAAMAPAAPVIAGAGRFSRPAPVQEPLPAVEDEYATADVAEAAVPVQDDLDLPEIAYDEAPAAPLPDPDYDYGELPLEQPAAASAPSLPPAGAPVYDEQPLRFEDDYASALADDALYAEFAEAQDAYPDETPALAQAVPLETEEKRRGSGMLIAAAVVGVALVGGIGAFAFSFGGSGGDSAPTLVRADSEPLKVKPENPGGTAVPNQDSQAYQRVAAGEPTAAPQQDRLVTTAEEPVSLAARAAEPANGLPGVDDEIAELDEVPPPAAKAEDRVEQPIETAGVGADQDLVAVQPRRVRTMIVRPDGTLVPREEAAPVLASAPPSALPPAIAAAPLTAPADAAAEPQAAPQATDTGLPAPRVVESVRITPEAPAPAAAPAPAPAAPAAAPQRAAETQRQTQVAQAAPAARQQPAAPQAAAAGEWSMQIASQPTADGAQASYQDLARRYGSIIGGRGVNIVRADIPGKGTYYRVRIPSSTRAEAISLCERYKAAGGSCFVSR